MKINHQNLNLLYIEHILTSVVDNIFVLFQYKHHFPLFARYINTRNKNVKFTFDFEQNNSFFKC